MKAILAIFVVICALSAVHALGCDDSHKPRFEEVTK